MTKKNNFINEMYDEICGFVDANPDIEEESHIMGEEFYRLSFRDCYPRKLFFDWFLFDYQLKKHRKRLFDVFLNYKKKNISRSLYDTYSKIGKDHFGFFKIKAVKIGKQFLCHDISTSAEYQVNERGLTKHINKGDYIIGRLLPFDGAFVLSSHCLCFQGGDGYDMFSFALKNILEVSAERLDAYSIYKALYPEEIPETLSVEEKFVLICKEGGFSDNDIEDVLLEMKIAIKSKKGLPQQILFGVLERIEGAARFDSDEFCAVFMDVWNIFANQIHQGVKKGPLEDSLVSICTDAVKNNFSIFENMSEEEIVVFREKCQQWSDAWFDLPQQELKGKTPKQVIMRERQKLGNPQKEFGYSFNYNQMPVMSAKEKKMQALADDAADQMNNKNYREALNLYEDYITLWDGNHVVWHNMGVCYVMLLQKRKAEKCLTKACSIDPDYELAHDKLEELQSMYREDMFQMVRKIKKNNKKK